MSFVETIFGIFFFEKYIKRTPEWFPTVEKRSPNTKTWHDMKMKKCTKIAQLN